MLTATAVWCVLILLYAAKWIWARARGPGGIPSSRTMLFHWDWFPVSTALIGIALRPYAPLIAASARDRRHRGAVDLWCVPHRSTLARRSRSEHHDTGALSPNGRRQFCQRDYIECVRPSRMGRAVFRGGRVVMARDRIGAGAQALCQSSCHRPCARHSAFSWHPRPSGAPPT